MALAQVKGCKKTLQELVELNSARKSMLGWISSYCKEVRLTCPDCGKHITMLCGPSMGSRGYGKGKTVPYVNPYFNSYTALNPATLEEIASHDHTNLMLEKLEKLQGTKLALDKGDRNLFIDGFGSINDDTIEEAEISLIRIEVEKQISQAKKNYKVAVEKEKVLDIAREKRKDEWLADQAKEPEPKEKPKETWATRIRNQMKKNSLKEKEYRTEDEIETEQLAEELEDAEDLKRLEEAEELEKLEEE